MAAGQGAGGTPCPTATDDPGLVSSELKVVTIPTQPAFPGRELRVAMSRAVPKVNTVHPCRVKSFRKAVSTVTDNLGKDDKTIE